MTQVSRTVAQQPVKFRPGDFVLYRDPAAVAWLAQNTTVGQAQSGDAR